MSASELANLYVVLRALSGGFVGPMDAATAAAKRFDGTMQSAAKVGGQLAEKSLRAISLASGAAAVASIKLAADFDSAMERVHTQAGASQAEVDRMRGALLKLAPAVGTGPQKLAESLYHVESVGLRGAKALDTVTAAAKLAKVGNADLEQTTNAVAAAYVTQMRDATSLTQITGLLNATVGQGNMRMNDLAAAISTGILPVAKNFGLGLADVGGALAVMTDRGMHADEGIIDEPVVGIGLRSGRQHVFGEAGPEAIVPLRGHGRGTGGPGLGGGGAGMAGFGPGGEGGWGWGGPVRGGTVVHHHQTIVYVNGAVVDGQRLYQLIQPYALRDERRNGSSGLVRNR